MKFMLSFVFLMLATFAALGDDDVRNLRFKPGSDGTVIAGSIRGYDGVSYLLDVRAGQNIYVAMTASNPQNYFNVTAPGSGSAVFIGSDAGNSFSGVARRSGKYRIDVYLMRAAARRGETSRYKLSVTVTGRGSDYGNDDQMQGDYADGDAGGPDNWVVKGVPPGDRLNIRTAPSSGAPVVARLRNGTVVQNLGCRTRNGSRWCKVSPGIDSGIRGWVNGRFLREY